MAVKKWELDTRDELVMKAKPANLRKGKFGGQDQPDNVTALIERVTKQELELVQMRKDKSALFDLIGSIWHDLNTNTETISIANYRRLEELCMNGGTL